MAARRAPSLAATPGTCMFRLNDDCNEGCKEKHIVCKRCWESMGPQDIERYKDILKDWQGGEFCTSYGCYEYLKKGQQSYCAACQQRINAVGTTPRAAIPPASSSSSTPGVRDSTPRRASSRSPRRYKDFDISTLLQMQRDIMKEIELRLWFCRNDRRGPG